jgi:hypothetical protein
MDDALDISINQAKQQSSTLHIGTHILSESSKDNAQTRYCVVLGLSALVSLFKVLL